MRGLDGLLHTIGRRTAITAISVMAIGFAAPTIAQQSTQMRHYAIYFKYSDAAAKAMTENTQDRAAAVRKLAEDFGGKLDAIYWTLSGAFDGFAIWELPDDVTGEAVRLHLRASGNFPNIEVQPIMDAQEFKAAMQKAKETKSGYTAPTVTK